MRGRFAFGLLASLLVMSSPISGAATRALPWHVGEEREIDAGLYMTLVSEISGWRIWREEGSGGKNCVAVKPANGVRQPTPLSSYMFHGGYPAIAVSETTVMGNKRIDWQLLGAYYQPQTQEFRNKGDRFYVHRPDLFASSSEWDRILTYGDRAIEVHVGSWRYPAISVGFSEQYGIIDLSGLSKAVEAMKACNAASSGPVAMPSDRNH